MENRKRPFAYTFRVTGEEKCIIDRKLKESGLTMTEFIIRAITNKNVIAIEKTGEIINELKRQGNNLNQLVKNNYYGLVTEQEILSCVKELKQTYKEALNTVGGK